jgi:LysM repeat protein/3D (Asp-Asp-Asp) domain-containing protein
MAQWINTGVLSLVLAGGLSSAVPAAGIANAQAETHVHTVQPGETVRDIAAAYGLNSVSVMAANALPNADLLQIGQSLVIPPLDGVLHTVKSGENLVGIADVYGVSAGDLVRANALASADNLSVGEVLVVPGVDLAAHAVQTAATQTEATVSVRDSPSDTYIVRDGDTLRSIAEEFKLDILSLVAMNSLDDPDLIRPGSQLVVSAQPLEHVVQPGDTLGDIAWHYSVDANALLRTNGLADPDRIVTGMTLVVPLGALAMKARSAPPAQAGASQPPAAAASAPTSGSNTRPAPTPTAAPARPPAPPAARPRTAAASPASGPITAKVTGYALGAGAVSTRTASGTTAHWGTVAADTRLYPFGTRLRIEGLDDTIFVVEDTGSAVRGNVFDVWFSDAASARRLGARTRRVSIVSPDEP